MDDESSRRPDVETGRIDGRASESVSRSTVVLTALRAILTTATLLCLYFLAPLKGAPSRSGALTLAFGLIGFTAVLSWQIRSVMRARAPVLRAVEVLATAAPFFLLMFATAYFVLARNDVTSFNVPLTRLDALYFTVTTFATVGFGDIAALSQTARTIVTIQMVGDLVVIGLGFRLLLEAVRFGLARRREPADVAATDRPSMRQITPSG